MISHLVGSFDKQKEVAFWDVATCFGDSTFWWKYFFGGGDVVWLRYSFHHRDTKWSMQGGWPSFLKLLELQGLTAPVKWKIFALWPNLQLEKWLHFLQFKYCLFGKQILHSLQIEEQKLYIFKENHLLIQKRLNCCNPTGDYGYMLKNNFSL